MLRPLPLVAVLALFGCVAPEPPTSGATAADSLAAGVADPPFAGTWWRLASLDGEAPVEGVRPVLVFTEAAALRDTYDRPYPDSLHAWRIVTGESGVGHLHAPYRLAGDTLRFAETYDYTRLSSDTEIAQARRLADALAATRTHRRDGPTLALLGAAGDTLATLWADPPRPPGPLDDTEWVLTHVGPEAVPDDVRATLAFSPDRLGPGPGDGFDAYGGVGGCNGYGGGYRLVPRGEGRFALETSGPPASTDMGCDPRTMAVETAVFAALADAAEVRLGGGDAQTATTLTLHDATGAQRLAFRRHEPYPVDLGALRTGRWRIVPDESPAAPAGADTEVTFADSTFEATSGCFVVRGTYAVDGDDLRVLAAEADRSTCTDLASVRAAPIASGKLSVTPDRLVLYDRQGTASVFERAE